MATWRARVPRFETGRRDKSDKSDYVIRSTTFRKTITIIISTKHQEIVVHTVNDTQYNRANRKRSTTGYRYIHLVKHHHHHHHHHHRNTVVVLNDLL